MRRTLLLLLPCLFWASAADLGPFQAELKALLPPNPKAGVAIGHFTADSETVTETVVFVGNPAFDRETLFEYGSITKVFTSVLLAELAQEGVVDLEQSVNRLLPENVRDEKWRDVTLFDLATHTSGLPRLPPNLSLLYQLRWGDALYARFDERLLYEAVRQVKLEPVGEHNYSNFGFGLLGELSARAADTPYQTLVTTHIFRPLEMAGATTVGWHSEQIAPPLSREGERVGHWDWDALAGAGAARGSVADALRFLRASARACRAPGGLAKANCRAQRVAVKEEGSSRVQGLAWIRLGGSAGDIVWHNGATGGFSSFLGFNVRTGKGLVVLANVASLDEVTSLSLEFLTAPK